MSTWVIVADATAFSWSNPVPKTLRNGAIMRGIIEIRNYGREHRRALYTPRRPNNSLFSTYNIDGCLTLFCHYENACLPGSVPCLAPS